MSGFTELLEPPASVPEIETYRGFESRSSTPRLASALLLDVEFEGRRRSLARPLKLTITSDENVWFAENESLNLFGSGDSPQAAFNDFCMHLQHFLARYRSLAANEVAGDGLRLKSIYDGLLGVDPA